jgi:exo-beta-1,3-glucanase (GH17 family)
LGRAKMHKIFSLFLFVAAVIIAGWWWLGRAEPMPGPPVGRGEKLYCLSYAPFHGTQTPLDLLTRITPEQIDRDLRQLATITDCIRTYSVDFGLDQVPELAKQHGLKVLLGLWVSSHADRTEYQLSVGIELARKYPDVIRAVIVGNEALLRGEVAPERLAEYIRTVKSRVAVPVTYADVWEFWMRHRALAQAVDFVTIHILPYWEDDPVAAAEAANHVDDIRKHVVASFPGKEVMIGEVGWPSAGRMREGALPSPANQARVLAEVLARGKRESFRVNVIEAYDQPWKRYLEGTVGGHWGLFDDRNRRPKFEWGAPVSNHPFWIWQAAGGVAMAGAIFAIGLLGGRRGSTGAAERGSAWSPIAVIAVVAGLMIGWTIENVPVESLGVGGWLRSLAYVVVAIAAPLAGAAALAASSTIPPMAQVIGAKSDRVRDRLSLTVGLLLVFLIVLAVQSALALAFDPRYRDFPFAPLTAAALPFALVVFSKRCPTGMRPLAETSAGLMLVLCAVAILWRETLLNWQALWFCSALTLLAFSLFRGRAAPS